MAQEAGKGSKQRPTDMDAYASGWDRIFGKNKRPLKSVTQEVMDYDIKTFEEEAQDMADAFNEVFAEELKKKE